MLPEQKEVKVNLNAKIVFKPIGKGKEVMDCHMPLFCGDDLGNGTYSCPLHEFIEIFGPLGFTTAAYVEKNTVTLVL